MSFTVLIPARLASTRLPDKPLADIAGLPMVVRVAQRAAQSSASRVVVAADSPRIAQACADHGVACVLTATHHPTGSDRLAEACDLLELPQDALVVNVQGDEPLIEPALIDACAAALQRHADCVMSTAAHPIADADTWRNPNVVKVVGSPVAPDRLRALYFTRATAPFGDGPLYHHIGLYAYRRRALARFVALPPSPLERRERLEQLRALEAGLRIDVAIVASVPLGVDTPEDLARARDLLAR